MLFTWVFRIFFYTKIDSKIFTLFYMDFIKKYSYLFFLFVSGVLAWVGIHQYIAELEMREANMNISKVYTNFETLINSKKIQEAYNIISNHYYKFSEHDKNDIKNGIIRGIVWSLEDKHSEFFTLDEAKEFHDTLAWDFEGIGAVIGDDKKWILIEKIIPDSPAAKANLQAGNIIIEVGGETMVGVPVKDAVKKIRGPKWTPVVLRLFDPIDSTFQTKTVTRDSIIVPSVQEKTLSGWLGYVEVSIFGEKTGTEFTKALLELEKQKVRWIIIDLRYNGGGFLDEAVRMLSNFIPKDLPLVSTKYTKAEDNETLFSLGGRYKDIPLVFLVNDMTASASEIMAGAIQDYERWIIVGQKTYGKWSVQQPFVLSDGSELKITIARWYTPKDRGIDGIGIKPDVEVLIKDEDYKNKYDRQLETSKDILENLIISKNRGETIKKFNPQ